MTRCERERCLESHSKMRDTANIRFVHSVEPNIREFPFKQYHSGAFLSAQNGQMRNHTGFIPAMSW